MTNRQRMKNDMTTMNRREMADQTRKDNRIKNDELTKEKRFNADKTMEGNRLRNDEITANRREINDRNPGRDLAIFLLILLVLIVGAYLIFI